MKVPFLDLKVDNLEKFFFFKSLNKIMNHGMFVMGPEVKKFENKITQFCNRKYCISVGPGTEALYLALKSLNLKENDEVITTSLSWIATANAIKLNNLKPVFADIDKDLNKVNTNFYQKKIIHPIKLKNDNTILMILANKKLFKRLKTTYKGNFILL